MADLPKSTFSASLMLPLRHWLTSPLLSAALLLLMGFVLYGSAGHDDSHITFWASYTLSEWGEILNYNGDRIEQSSSLLFTLLIALVAFVLQQDVVTVGYLLCYLAGATAVLLAAALLNSKKGVGVNFSPEKITPTPFLPTPIFLLLLITSPAFLLWNTSGMESTLAAACVLWFVLAWGNLLNETEKVGTRSLTLASFATFALISVRPEMISLAAAAVFLFFIWKRVTGARGNLPILLFYSTVLLCIALLVGWRYFYFGSPMPLPVYAKVNGLEEEKIRFGLLYLFHSGLANPLWIAGVIAALAYLIPVLRHKYNGQPIDHRQLLAALLLLAYSAFIVLSGGDWMQAGRFLVPVLPLAALLCVRSPLLQGRWMFASFVVLVLLLNSIGNFFALEQQSHGTPLWAGYRISPEHQQRYSLFEQYNQEHLRDMDVIDRLHDSITSLQGATAEPVTLLSGQSGMVFYYTAKQHFRQVRFYDNRGLVEKSLLKCRLVDDVPRSSQGLYFDLDGFFARQPALQERCGIPRPDFLYDINDLSRELPQRMEAQGYVLLHKEGGKMMSTESSLPIYALPAVNFLMVDAARTNQLDHPQLSITRYHEKPLVHRFP